jgi:hypothetical protein
MLPETMKLELHHKTFMAGFLAGFGFYTALFFIGYFWRLKQLMG